MKNYSDLQHKECHASLALTPIPTQAIKTNLQNISMALGKCEICGRTWLIGEVVSDEAA